MDLPLNISPKSLDDWDLRPSSPLKFAKHLAVFERNSREKVTFYQAAALAECEEKKSVELAICDTSTSPPQVDVSPDQQQYDELLVEPATLPRFKYQHIMKLKVGEEIAYPGQGWTFWRDGQHIWADTIPIEEEAGWDNWYLKRSARYPNSSVSHHQHKGG